MAEMNHKKTDPALTQEENGALRARRSSVRGVGGGHPKQRRTFHLFDVIVIVFVVLLTVLLVVGVRVTDVFGGEEGNKVRLSYTLTVYGVDEAFADAISLGDALYDVDSKVTLGTVKQVPTVVAHKAVALEGGKADAAVMKPVPSKVDITFTVETEAYDTEGVGYTVGGRAIRIGESYTVRFPNYVGNVSCVAINGAVDLD